MADSVSSVSSLLIETLFVDGDTRTITIKNPTDNLTMNDFADLSSWLSNNQVLIGDRNGAAFSKIKQARNRSTTTLFYDI